MVVLIALWLGVKMFVLFATCVCVCVRVFGWVQVIEWPPIGTIAAHSAYDMFSWYTHLIVNLDFSHLGFWSGDLFRIAPFPDHCLLVPFHVYVKHKGASYTCTLFVWK